MVVALVHVVTPTMESQRREMEIDLSLIVCSKFMSYLLSI